MNKVHVLLYLCFISTDLYSYRRLFYMYIIFSRVSMSSHKLRRIFYVWQDGTT